MQNENKNTVAGTDITKPASNHTFEKPMTKKQPYNPNAKQKYTKKKYPKEYKNGNAKTPMVAPKKVKLLFTIVNRQKTEFFVDFLQEFEINMQLVLSAQGTANDHIISLLGLTDSDKSVIISVIRQDKIKDAFAALEDKFNTAKNGKGIAYTVPIKSAIGVAIYRFLSNTTGGGLING